MFEAVELVALGIVLGVLGHEAHASSWMYFWAAVFVAFGLGRALVVSVGRRAD